MICPVCKVDMIAVEYQKIELDYCTRCQGVWFDCGEVDLLLKSVQPEKTSQSNPLALAAAKTAEAKRKCPICGRKMNKAQTSDEPKVLIDACPKDDGLWFDGGEVDHLIKGTNHGEGVVSFISEVFQAKDEPFSKA